MCRLQKNLGSCAVGQFVHSKAQLTSGVGVTTTCAAPGFTLRATCQHTVPPATYCAMFTTPDRAATQIHDAPETRAVHKAQAATTSDGKYRG
jgi:hypothetical protein